MYAAPKPDYPIIDAATLATFDAFIMGIPTRFGNFPGQWKVLSLALFLQRSLTFFAGVLGQHLVAVGHRRARRQVRGRVRVDCRPRWRAGVDRPELDQHACPPRRHLRPPWLFARVPPDRQPRGGARWCVLFFFPSFFLPCREHHSSFLYPFEHYSPASLAFTARRPIRLAGYTLPMRVVHIPAQISTRYLPSIPTRIHPAPRAYTRPHRRGAFYPSTLAPPSCLPFLHPFSSLFPTRNAADTTPTGSPWGAGTFAASDGSRQPSALELEIANIQGKMFYNTVSKVKF